MMDELARGQQGVRERALLLVGSPAGSGGSELVALDCGWDLTAGLPKRQVLTLVQRDGGLGSSGGCTVIGSGNNIRRSSRAKRPHPP